MPEITPPVPARFVTAYNSIQLLANDPRYLAAFIFGSLARGEVTDQSDLDVRVIVDEDNSCSNVNHPIIGGVKIDLSFASFEQLRRVTQREMETRERIPMIAESLIIFDKTGELTYLREMASQAQPRVITPAEHQWVQFMFFHANNKVERNLEADPPTALLAMHIGINALLQFHYQLHGKWWVSNKRMLRDLRRWDSTLASLLEHFVVTGDIQEKFSVWSAIIDHILEPLGGRQPISENNCSCEVCTRDLQELQKVYEQVNRPSKS